MKKKVFKRERINRVHKKENLYNQERPYRRKNIYRLAGRWAAVMTALCLLAGTVLTVYGEEKSQAGFAGSLKAKAVMNASMTASAMESMTAAIREAETKTVVTDICHKHIGSPDVQGGCYTKETEHHHDGDEKNGGDCYQIPIIHGEHQGDAIGGGGCYGKPVRHIHEGDCYVKHTHKESCFQSIECTEEYTQVEPFETLEKNCLHHGITTFDRAKAVIVHTVCGKEPEEVVITYCQICGPHITMHMKEEQLCPYKENEPERDNPICGKEEGVTVDSYEINCGFEKEQVERYGLSCGKTIEGYEIDCGLAQGSVLGNLILTSKTDEEGKKAVVSVKVEELLFGRLILGANPYEWQDAQGNIIGNGKCVEVENNGEYSVILKVENKDVEESGLHSSILVDGIYKEETNPSPRPSEEPKASASPAGSGEGTGGKDKDDGDKDEKDKIDEGTENEGSGEGGEDKDAADVTKTQPVKKEKEIGSVPEKAQDRKASFLAGDIGSGSGQGAVRATPCASPQKQLKIMKKTDSVRTKENEAAKEVVPQMKQAETRKGFFASPIVRIITVTAGTMLLIAGIVLLLFYLRRSVRIYNDDGEGRMHYMGRTIVQREEDLYFITISDAMVERSYTNRYCIKSGLFRLGKEEETELGVYKEDKKAVVPLDREMIVII